MTQEITLLDLPRNDFAAARRYYEAKGKRISAEEFRVLILLQDDPDEFEERTAGWNVIQKPEPEIP